MCYFRQHIKLDELQYWNVELQEPYFSYVEAAEKREKSNYFHLLCDQIHFDGLLSSFF